MPLGETSLNLPVVNVYVLSRITMALGLSGFPACRDDDGLIVPHLQPISAPRYPYKVDASPKERFPRHADRSGRFRYVLGSGWAELRRTDFRWLNFAVGDGGRGECYVSEIRGFVDGGLENINRWRGQFGLGAITASELAKLPRKPFAGQEAIYLKLEGTFSGMGGIEPERDYCLLGMLMMRGCDAYSAKMIGPQTAFKREESEFLAFCETLEIAPDPKAQPYMLLKVGPFEFLRPCDWDFVVPQSDALVGRPVAFVIGPNREARIELGFPIGPGGGGVDKVINGWLRDKGREPLGQEAIAALPDQFLLGSLGKWLEIEAEEETFVGIVSQLANEGHESLTVLATLHGSSSVVNDEKDKFRAFAKSLRVSRVKSGGGSPH